ncbi:3-hydroxyacyl-CoA dehydrogenase [Xylophilus sp. GOD-11R]|uniref:3-hydroxyacyl-CoA dehydrogenase n=1 Tax=Xylophilus sp. GOD-11R TaxID=3089814 RepID=UPI00298C10D2|nr:3-hydroxyacyl-CoA dehydrogenase [Xylophilus sp. GOD-11R]WPB59488.1 3-hydroxyacyl-CoA dehydrogenase [Xylophilus sp. GOD-11R]
MGRGIAQACAAAGCEVQLFDMAADAVARALDAVRTDLAQGVAKGRLSQEDLDATMARLQGIGDIALMADRDLVVEAIVEKLEPKQQLFRQLEGIVGPDCVLATNTSSLSVTAIAANCERPQRVAGWHFFNPVTRMRVVEVIQAPRTSDEAVEALGELSRRMGHRGVRTSDSPGFVVNHAGRAFVTEGLKLLSERTAEHPVLDGILRSCAGFRMGPLELLDLTGLDVSVPVMESIHGQYYGDDRYRPSPLARTRLLAGLLGRKAGQGFYRYEAGAGAATPADAKTLAAPYEGAVWWPDDGPAALPAALAEILGAVRRVADPAQADLLLLAPLAEDLSTTVATLGLDAARAVAIDPLFGSRNGVTLMASPATSGAAIDAAQAAFAAAAVPAFVIADSPGYVAPRVVACVVNLACEMAQQAVASPADIDAAVRLGLGYPMGPFEWGDKLGATRVLEVLRGLQTTFGDQRYRPAPWLVRRARLGLSLSAPDRQP